MFTKRGTWLLGIVALAALAMALAACRGDDAPAEPPTDGQSVDLSGLVIAMSRHGECYGPCRHYTITIREDGSFEYEGQRDVDVVGVRRGEIDLEDVRRLVQRFEDSGLFDLPAGSRCSVTDVPITTTSVQLGDRNQAVEHCVRRDETRELVSIEASIDELTDSLRWTGPPRSADWPDSDD